MIENNGKAQALGVADPVPLGFAAFALAAFALGVNRIGLAPDVSWVGLALIAGGVAQFVAGMWAFLNRTTFWATAFSVYGVSWLTLGTYFILQTFGRVSTGDSGTSLGYLLLGFAIFNTYMLFWSARLNLAVFGAFLALEVTEVVLFLGFLSSSDVLVRLGGWLGVLTALVAWYASAASVLNTMGPRALLWTGTPIWTQPAAAERERTSARR
jgi:succinate-acetate transporter protein